MKGDGTIPISDSILFWTPVCHVANVCAYYNPSSLLQVHADHPVDILPLREKLLTASRFFAALRAGVKITRSIHFI